MLDVDGGVLGASSTVTDDEEVAVEVEDAGTYVVRVYGFNGAENDYSLSVSIEGCQEEPRDDGFEDNDTQDVATRLEPGEFGELVINANDDVVLSSA